MQNKKTGFSRNSLAIGAAIVIAVAVGLFVFGGGHNQGQPSAPSGPGNVMQKDQGR